MSRLLTKAREFLHRNDGASVVEYALALLLICVVTMVVIGLLGNSLSTFFTSAAGSI
jgi:Flp pilus assembly pilin Flp